MGMFSSMDISASAMSAERFRMDVIAQNIANVNTSSTAAGTPYRRKIAVVTPNETPQFMLPVSFEEGNHDGFAGQGVQVAGVLEDQAEFKYVYDPENPQAIKEGKWEGYVAMPNVNIISEMTSMMAASRAYEANVTAVEAAKSMALKALEIGEK